MPGFDDKLSSEARWDLIDYLRAHNAGESMRTTGKWPHPLPVPQFDATCPDGRTIDLDDLRGRVLRIVAVFDDDDAATASAPPAWTRNHNYHSHRQGRPQDQSRQPAWQLSPKPGLHSQSCWGCRAMHWREGKCWLIRTGGYARNGSRAIREIGPTRRRSRPQSATLRRIRSPIQSADTRIITDDAAFILDHRFTDIAAAWAARCNSPAC